MNQILVVNGVANTLRINNDVVSVLSVNTKDTLTVIKEEIRILTMAQQGPPGPPGPPGDKGDSADALIGGFPIEVSQPATGDVLSFTGTTWANLNKVQLVDGGNF